MDTPSCDNEVPSTLYPKIHKLSDFVHHLKKTQNGVLYPTWIALTGTVKLRGTHADIVFPSVNSNDFRLQSRNRVRIVPGKEDNAGFAQFIQDVPRKRILALRDRIVSRHTELHPGDAVHGEIIVAGEWCGQGIQKGVALSQIPKFLAIISVQIKGKWLSMYISSSVTCCIGTTASLWPLSSVEWLIEIILTPIFCS